MSRKKARRAEGRPPALCSALYVAFGGVSVAFVLSTAISEYADVRIQRAAAQITGTTAPAVAGLATLRGELRWYELLADDVADRGVEGVPQPPSPELGHARAAIEREWGDYRALGLPREETRVAVDGVTLKADVDAAIDRFEGQAARADWSAARDTLANEVRPATERFDEGLMRLVERHAERGAALAQRIERLGRQSITLAVALDATSLLLALFTALMVVRVERRYTELIERRAEELELFAGRVAHDVLGPLGAASLALDVAAAEAEPGGRTARLVGSGRAGLRRARTIADALLEFARAGAQPTPGERAEVGEVVRAVVDEVEPEAKLRGVAVAVELELPARPPRRLRRGHAELDRLEPAAQLGEVRGRRRGPPRDGARARGRDVRAPRGRGRRAGPAAGARRERLPAVRARAEHGQAGHRPRARDRQEGHGGARRAGDRALGAGARVPLRIDLPIGLPTLVPPPKVGPGARQPVAEETEAEETKNDVDQPPEGP